MQFDSQATVSAVGQLVTDLTEPVMVPVLQQMMPNHARTPLQGAATW